MWWYKNMSKQEILLENINDIVKFSYITSMLENEKILYRVSSGDVGNYLEILHGRSYLGKNIYVRKVDYHQAKQISGSYASKVLPEHELMDISNSNLKITFEAHRVMVIIYIIFGFFMGTI